MAEICNPLTCNAPQCMCPAILLINEKGLQFYGLTKKIDNVSNAFFKIFNQQLKYLLGKNLICIHCTSKILLIVMPKALTFNKAFIYECLPV